jgi:elongation factor Ts
MDYAATDVKKLREETGATFADCKSALTQASKWDDAVKYIEARRDKKAEKMVIAGRETKEGGVFSYVHHNNRVGVLVELNCSTDFVSRSESFRSLANDIAIQIVGAAPDYVSFEDVPAEILAAARQRIEEEYAAAGKEVVGKEEEIANRLKKQFGERVLLMQPWVKDGSVAIGDLVRKVIASTGENIVVRRFSRFALGE